MIFSKEGRTQFVVPRTASSYAPVSTNSAHILSLFQKGDQTKPMPKEYDIFVSYAHVDHSHVWPIVEALRTLGLRVWFDDTDIEDFSSITRSVKKGIASSGTFLAYYSLVYPTRRACQWELTAAFLAAQAASAIDQRILIINPEPDVTGSSHIDPVDLRDLKYVPASGPEGLSKLASLISSKALSANGSFGELPAALAPSWYGYRGIGAKRFVGRQAEMWQIYSVLHSNIVEMLKGYASRNIALVSGLGGIGKSLIAEEYALRFGSAFPAGLFWLSAHIDDHNSLDQARVEAFREIRFRTLAEQYGVNTRERSTEEIESAFRRALERTEKPYLWIVDDMPPNLDSLTLRKWFAPSENGKTLITTRSRTYASQISGIDLGVLPNAEAYDLLTARRQPDSVPEELSAQGIIKLLGHHALAIDVAGGLLAEVSGLQSFGDFEASLIRSDVNTLELAKSMVDELPNGHERSIVATLLSSTTRLSESARDVLLLASELAEAPISKNMIARVFMLITELDDRHDDSPQLVTSDLRTPEYSVAMAVKEVSNLSLADLATVDGSSILVHTLVSRILRWQEDYSERRRSLRGAAISVLLKVSSELSAASSLAKIQTDMVHASKLSWNLETAEEARLMHYLAYFRYLSGDFRDAVILFEHILAQIDQRHHSEDPIAIRNELAAAFLKSGNHNRAIDLQIEVVAAREAMHGPSSNQTLDAKNTLGAGLRAAGRLSEARLMFENLNIIVDTRGGDDEITLISRHNLARTLLDLGELNDARVLLDKVLQSASTVLGEQHPNLMAFRETQACALIEAGDVSEGFELQRTAVEGYCRILGAEHPATLTARHNLADSLNLFGQHKRALEEHNQILSIRRRVLGEEHPHTLVSRFNIAKIIAAHEDIFKGIDLYREALDLEILVCGQNHPDTLNNKRILAELLLMRGKVDGEALRLLAEVLDQCELIYGLFHEVTIGAAWTCFCAFDEVGAGKEAMLLARKYFLPLLEREQSTMVLEVRLIRDQVRSLVFLVKDGQVKIAKMRGEQLFELGGLNALFHPST